MIDKGAKIYVAGHNGLVGSAILNNLKKKNYSNIVVRSHAELDLTDQQAVSDFFSTERPEYVILAAAKVGGIGANNTYRAQFIYENLMIQNNVIHSSYKNNVKKLLFLGSTCIYPKNAHQPMSEDELLTAPLEYTNEPYAIAKIAGIKMCESYNLQYGTNFISVMPTNLYGPNDNFDLETSHVLPAMLRKLHLGHCLETGNWEYLRLDLNARPIDGLTGNSPQKDILEVLAKYGIKKKNDNTVQVEMWGTGNPMREFLWSEDMADASVYIMENVDFLDLTKNIKNAEIRNTHINIGTGNEIPLNRISYLIKEIVNFGGEIWFNAEKPDGTKRKLTNVTKLSSLGWRHKIDIQDGLNKLYNWYLQNIC